MPETTDSIMAELASWAEEAKQVRAQEYLDKALKLTALSTYDADALVAAELAVARKKFAILAAQEKKNVAAAEIEVEASDEYTLLRRLQEKEERRKEIGRLAKKYSDINTY